MSTRFASLVLLSSLGLALVGGCSSSSDPTPAGTSGTSGQPATGGTTLRGAITGGAESGVLDISIPGATTTTKTLTPLADPASNTVTGAITFKGGGGTITLTGTYDAVTGNFSVMGGGYSLTGNLKNGVATGSYTGPKGGGQFTANATSAGAVTVYCGSFMSQGETGNWNVACTAGGACSGSFYSTTKMAGGTLTGTIAGTTITLSDASGKGTPATGTVAGTAVTGMCPNSCTFQGSVEACTK
jgi:hypothetical protein